MDGETNGGQEATQGEENASQQQGQSKPSTGTGRTATVTGGVALAAGEHVLEGRGHNAKEILIPKISVTCLDDYTRNVGYKTGAITYEFETKTFNYDRGIRLFADVMDVEEA